MVFDKNEFKEFFRRWAEAHCDANDDEAFEFCQKIIPSSEIVTNYWLIEQSMSWFRWLRNQRTFRGDLEEDDSIDIIVQ